MAVAMTGAIVYWANHEASWVWLLVAVSVGLLLYHKPQGQGLRQG